MTTDETDNGWDSLADEFGLSADKPAEKAEKPNPPPSRPARPASNRPARNPRPEVEAEADDFGSGLAEDVTWKQAALYDPGPEAVAEDSDELGEAPEPLDDTEEPEDAPPTLEGATEGQEGGKKRRRRRRRKKKGGPGAPAPDAGEEGEADAEPEAEAGDGVEEGEAPAEVEEDDEDDTPPSVVDEEMDAEAAGPRPQWHVMTWNELVSKLHRPG